MSSQKPSKEMQKDIEKADPERLSGYIDMFDRLLLYNLAFASMPPEVIEEMVGKWEDVIKNTIDVESNMRTVFLESTPQGRAAKMQKQPDGEELRLLFLHTLNTAKTIVTKNLIKDNEDDVGFDSSQA